MTDQRAWASSGEEELKRLRAESAEPRTGARCLLKRSWSGGSRRRRPVGVARSRRGSEDQALGATHAGWCTAGGRPVLSCPHVGWCRVGSCFDNSAAGSFCTCPDMGGVVSYHCYCTRASTCHSPGLALRLLQQPPMLLEHWATPPPGHRRNPQERRVAEPSKNKGKARDRPEGRRGISTD